MRQSGMHKIGVRHYGMRQNTTPPKKQAKNQPDLTIPRNVPLASGSLGAIRNTNPVLDGLDDQAKEDYERSRAERNARKAE
jgi:hypothetical protein